MRSGKVLAFAASVVLAASTGTVRAQETAAQAGASANPVFLQPGELKWVDLDPKGAPGVKIADVRGDHATGAYSAFLKLPAGFVVPLHTHTHEMRVVFLSGTYLQAPEGKPEVRLGPGSFMVQPGGNYRHTTGCDKASECVFLVESDGPFDLHVVPEATAPAKK
jgi:anti-sigma factor ChrR (cupin superfamily)